MKKRLIIIIPIVLIIAIVLVLLFYNKKTYKINFETVDAYSPERKLIVYENDKEIEFKEIRYEDGTILCYGTNPIASYTDIKDIKTLIVKLNNDKKVEAQVIIK